MNTSAPRLDTIRDKPTPSLSGAQLGELLTLLAGADTVELKVTVPEGVPALPTPVTTAVKAASAPTRVASAGPVRAVLVGAGGDSMSTRVEVARSPIGAKVIVCPQRVGSPTDVGALAPLGRAPSPRAPAPLSPQQ